MRRPFRYLLGATAFVSALLFVATAGLWVRGYYALDGLAIRVSDTHQISALSSRGHLCFMQMYLPAGATGSLEFDDEPGFQTGPPRSFGEAFALNALGFYIRQPKFGEVVWRVCVVPAWFALLVTAILPGVWVARRASWKRPGFAVETST